MAASALMLFVELALIRWSGVEQRPPVVLLQLRPAGLVPGHRPGLPARRARPATSSPTCPSACSSCVALHHAVPRARSRARRASWSSSPRCAPRACPPGCRSPLHLPRHRGHPDRARRGRRPTFREFDPLNAYRWDIVGSLLGTLAFTWSVVPAGRRSLGVAVVAVVFVVLLGAVRPGAAWISRHRDGRWSSRAVLESVSRASPVVAVLQDPHRDDNVGAAGRSPRIQVNGIPHQNVLASSSRLKTQPFYGCPVQRAVGNPLDDVLDHRRGHRQRRRRRAAQGRASRSTRSRSTRGSMQIGRDRSTRTSPTPTPG